jgi:hypothetical protein
MAVKRSNLKKTESIQVKSIAAINKAGTLVGQVPKVLEAFNEIKEELQIIKDDMDLGLQQYEAEIEERKGALNESFDALEKDRQEALDLLDETIRTKKSSNAKEMEELNYQHTKAKERESLATAEVIAEKYGKMVVEQEFVANLDANVEEKLSNLRETHEAELKEKSRGYAIAENKLKAEASKEKVVLETQLEAAQNRISDLTETVTYLKAQLNAEREASTERVASLKSDVTVNNELLKK